MPLFERNPLSDDSGLLRPRYLQEGSIPVSGTERFSASESWYTISTAGKILYLTDLHVQIVAYTSGTNVLIREVFSSTTLVDVDIRNYTGGEVVIYHFDTPIAVNNTLGVFVVGTHTLVVTWTGWEE